MAGIKCISNVVMILADYYLMKSYEFVVCTECDQLANS